jgi:hypothetical protein
MKILYRVLSVPIFPANIYICLDEAGFRQLLKDKNVPQKIDYLEGGAMAEVHSTPTLDGRTLISLIMDLSAIDDLDCTLVHESVHLVYRIFEYMNEETPGEEIRAYLTEFIFREIKKILDEPNIRKRYRKILEQKNEAVIGALIQMAELSVGGAGSNSISSGAGTPSRTKNTNGKAKPKARVNIQRSR